MRPFRRDILEEHFEEAAFLFRLRELAFDSYARRLDSMAALEERLLAHLDGLAVADSAGWDVARAGLGSKVDGESFVASFTAVVSPSEETLGALGDALASPKGARGHRRGLRLARGPRAGDALQLLAKHKEIGVRAAALDALVFRGDTREVAELPDYLRSDIPQVLRAGLEIASRIRPRNAEREIARALSHDDPGVVSAAHRAALLSRLPEAHSAGTKLAAADDPRAPRALAWHALAAAPDARAVLAAAADKPQTSRTALLSIAHMGDAGSADRILRAIGEKGQSRAAGHALELLFGIDLVEEGLTLSPEEVGSVQLDDLDPDEEFAWPDPRKVERWWASRQAKPPAAPNVPWEKLLEDARDAALPTREAAILRARLNLPNVGPFETRGWADDQRRAFPDLVRQVAEAARGKSAGR